MHIYIYLPARKSSISMVDSINIFGCDYHNSPDLTMIWRQPIGCYISNIQVSMLAYTLAYLFKIIVPL